MAAMDTDEQQNTPQTNLRRSNSAPLINGANLPEANISYLPNVTPRNRRSSTSQMANGNPYSVVCFIDIQLRMIGFQSFQIYHHIYWL